MDAVAVGVPVVLAGLSGVLMMGERWHGSAFTLELRMKGDIKRESRWFAQYGQTSCTLVTALLLGALDRRGQRVEPWLMVIIAVLGTSAAGTLIKRLSGRVRPGHDHAGRFLGFTWRHENRRESFPSTHTACAVAFSYVLAGYYPPAAPIFWGLAIICGGLRYLLDAHWPSDVLAGGALGWTIGAACIRWL